MVNVCKCYHICDPMAKCSYYIINYMIVYLKVHVESDESVHYKGHQASNMRPRQSYCSEFAKVFVFWVSCFSMRSPRNIDVGFVKYCFKLPHLQVEDFWLTANIDINLLSLILCRKKTHHVREPVIFLCFIFKAKVRAAQRALALEVRAPVLHQRVAMDVIAGIPIYIP